VKRAHRLLAVIGTVALLATSGCALVGQRPEGCRPDHRLGLVAQSVPTAAYVPCVPALPQGWSTTHVDVRSGSTELQLLADRGGGEPTLITLSERCSIGTAAPFPPRADGVRSYLRIDTTAPVYAGTLYDVFAGGCVSYEFAFERGPHITLLEQLQQAVRLYPRRQLRLELRDRFGVELDS
jgi:hypothetical protein